MGANLTGGWANMACHSVLAQLAGGGSRASGSVVVAALAGARLDRGARRAAAMAAGLQPARL